MEDVLTRAKTALSLAPQDKAGEIINQYWESKVKLIGAISKTHNSIINDDSVFGQCLD